MPEVTRFREVPWVAGRHAGVLCADCFEVAMLVDSQRLYWSQVWHLKVGGVGWCEWCRRYYVAAPPEEDKP